MCSKMDWTVPCVSADFVVRSCNAVRVPVNGTWSNSLSFRIVPLILLE